MDKEDVIIPSMFCWLLSPDAAIRTRRREIGQENIQDLYAGKRKGSGCRKKNLTWDPRNPDRLIVDMDSDREISSFRNKAVLGLYSDSTFI